MSRHPRSLEIGAILQARDTDGVFRWGGDGDEGEFILDLLDEHFNNEPEHGKYTALVQAARTFVDRCEKGSIRSKRTYAEMKMALQATEEPVPFVPEGADHGLDSGK